MAGTRQRKNIGQHPKRRGEPSPLFFPECRRPCRRPARKRRAQPRNRAGRRTRAARLPEPNPQQHRAARRRRARQYARSRRIIRPHGYGGLRGDDGRLPARSALRPRGHGGGRRPCGLARTGRRHPAKHGGRDAGRSRRNHGLPRPRHQPRCFRGRRRRTRSLLPPAFRRRKRL